MFGEESSTPIPDSNLWVIERLAGYPDVPRFEFSLSEVIEAYEVLDCNERSLFALVHYAHHIRAQSLVETAHQLRGIFP